MTFPIDFRAALTIAGLVAVVVAAGPAVAQAADVSGAVTYRDGAAIPEGHLEISLEGQGGDAKARVATRLASDGAATEIAFVLPSASAAGEQTLRIVARLERADGWLLARGSASVAAGTPVRIKLSDVMY